MPSNNSATVDKYLEAIFYIAFEGEVVRPGRLAKWLSVSPPTVSEALGRLRRDGWITIKKDRSAVLTSAGQKAASNLVRHHRILERWLTDVLGLDWATADDEADRLSSAISDFLIDRIDAALERPLTCPHGNVIPGRAAPYGKLTALANLAVGEMAEGSLVQVVDVAVAQDEIGALVGGKRVALPVAAAQLIWVEVAT